MGYWVSALCSFPKKKPLIVIYQERKAADHCQMELKSPSARSRRPDFSAQNPQYLERSHRFELLLNLNLGAFLQ
jgi:hypothetical protein